MDTRSIQPRGFPVYARAVNLLSKCASWIRDVNLSDNESPWSIFYAVDTDVIAMYLSPDGTLSYGDVFGSDGETAALLGRLLGDFLFRTEPSPTYPRPSATNSFLLIPPHDEELFRMLLAVGKKVATASNISPKQFETLSQIFEIYKNDGNEAKLLSSLEKQVPELVMLYDANRGAKAELDRFADMRDDKLINIETFHQNNFSFPVIGPGIDVDHFNKFREKVEDWQKLLKKHQRSRKQPAYALMGDAHVLATIEYLNGRLEEERKRILLVTGSPYLYDAANEYVPLEANPGGETFAYLYLRHPQWILAHPDFFHPNQSLEKGTKKDKSDATASDSSLQRTAFNLLEWLGILFPDVIRDGISNRVVIDSNALKDWEFYATDTEARQTLPDSAYVELGGRTLSKIPEEWALQIKMAALGKIAINLDRPNGDAAEQLADVIKAMVGRKRWSFHNFRDAIFGVTAQSLSRMYFNAVWLGLWSNQAVFFEHIKGMPRLRFDPPNKAVDTYCRKVLKLQSLLRQLTSTDVESLVKANEELMKVDSSLYHSHIVHALAFASKGRWEAAFTLCKIAMNIADSLPRSNDEFRKGREAAYLAAIACRRSAGNIEDLERAKYFLAEARRRENKGSDLDIRFKNESLAIDARKIYFRYYVDGDPNVESYVHRVLNELKSIRNEAAAPQNDNVRKWVLRQCYTNFFDLILILVDLGKYERDEHTLTLLGEFKTLLDVERHVEDPHANLVCGIASIVIDTASKAQNEEVVQKLSIDSQTMQPILPYDVKRTEMFRRLICNVHF